MIREDIRNIAIIAHVDHGKTTLVDQMLKQGGIYRKNQSMVDRVMDSHELERERGITILSKNTSISYLGVKINIVDTPGHADFSGEVERVLKMVDGVILLVDSFEGPMPQTRFVLSKALDLNLKVLMVVNKIDRPDARNEQVVEELLDLLIDLDADNDILEAPILYISGREGTASTDFNLAGENLSPLFEAILKYIPAPVGEIEGPAQVLVSTIDYDDYMGRIGIGRVARGVFKEGMNVCYTNEHTGYVSPVYKLSNLFTFEGLNRIPAKSLSMGDIIALSGIEDLSIGDTVCDAKHIEPLPFVKISEPTVRMTFSVNDSPFAGQEGTYVTSRHIKNRLEKELQTDVSLRVNSTEDPDKFEVWGRGELHLSILIETMRREGYEFQVSKPQVVWRNIDGATYEPMEHVVIDVPKAHSGVIIEKLGLRKGIMTNMSGFDRVRLEFKLPSRGLFGYRSEFLSDTRGEGIMSSTFDGYEPFKGEILTNTKGSLICFEDGEATSYGLFNAQDRGQLFVGRRTKVYTGMVCGQSLHPMDVIVNVCRKKQATNIRNAAAAEDSLRLVSHRQLSLEECMELITDDELIEVTPSNLRIRKRILNHSLRARQNTTKQQV